MTGEAGDELVSWARPAPGQPARSANQATATVTCLLIGEDPSGTGSIMQRGEGERYENAHRPDIVPEGDGPLQASPWPPEAALVDAQRAEGR